VEVGRSLVFGRRSLRVRKAPPWHRLAYSA